jgi:O-antigen/teichoic acid export membrane protein
MGQAFLPVLFERVGQRDYNSARKVFFTAVKLNAAVILPVVLMACFSRQIMGLYGKEYSGGWATLILVISGAALQAIQVPAGWILIASSRMWLAFGLVIAWASTFSLCTRLLLSQGSAGIALAKLLAILVHTICCFVFVYYFFKRAKRSEQPVVTAPIAPAAVPACAPH